MVKISLFSSSPVTILIPLGYYWFFLGYFEVILIFRELPWFAFQLITLVFLLFSLLILICYSRNQKKCPRYFMAQDLIMIITDRSDHTKGSFFECLCYLSFSSHYFPSCILAWACCNLGLFTFLRKELTLLIRISKCKYFKFEKLFSIQHGVVIWPNPSNEKMCTEVVSPYVN